VSGFQRSREALGRRLREMRSDAHLTGRQLAAAAGWQPSKVSKIEGGRQTPSSADLRAWARFCGTEAEMPELSAALRSLDDQYTDHRRMFRTGLPGRQRSIAEIEARTTFTRNFEPCFIPGLLQTPEYARNRFAEGDEGDQDRGVPRSEAELEEAIAARIERQQVIYRPGKMHHFVVTEAALRYTLCPPDVMAGQLGQLIAATSLQTIQFGVIPFSTPMPVGPLHGFYIYDKSSVFVELYTAGLHINQPNEIAAYLRVFGHLAAAAHYGAAARNVITSALTDLSA
jgi:transcriptional regulator with XRE-family HTH domain